MRPDASKVPLEPPQSISVRVNGQIKYLPSKTSLTDLIRDLELDPLRLAVELNKEILKREQFPDVYLSTGDTLEIVHFVGGG